MTNTLSTRAALTRVSANASYFATIPHLSLLLEEVRGREFELIFTAVLSTVKDPGNTQSVDSL